MEPPEKVISHGFLEHRDIAAVASHVEKNVPKGVKTAAEHGLVEETVLAEHIQLAVRDDRPGQEQFVPRIIAQVMHDFGLRRASFL